MTQLKGYVEYPCRIQQMLLLSVSAKEELLLLLSVCFSPSEKFVPLCLTSTSLSKSFSLCHDNERLVVWCWWIHFLLFIFSLCASKWIPTSPSLSWLLVLRALPNIPELGRHPEFSSNITCQYTNTAQVSL